MPGRPLPGAAAGDNDTSLTLMQKEEKRAHVPREEWRRLHPKPPREKGSGDADFGKKGGPARARLVRGVLRSRAELEAASPLNLKLWGLTSVEAYFETEDRRAAAKVSLDALVRDPEVSPAEKHDAVARHHVVWGRSTFACAKCWLLKGNCVCRHFVKATATRGRSSTSNDARKHAHGGVPSQPSMRPPYVRVLAYAHHHEVARGNSTGVLIPSCLPFGELLVAGVAEHEARLERVLRESAGRVAVLWPRDTMGFAAVRERLRDARANDEVAARGGGGDDDDDDDDETFGWTFVAVDATWNSARKMVSRIPVSVPRVGVPADAFEALAARVPPLPTHDSLLGPVRKYDARKGAASEALKGKEQERRALGSSGAEGSGRRSTFEAVLASLLAVGALDEDACAALLRNVKVKVNAVLRQKHMPEAYDLRGEGGDAEEVASAFANAQV